MANIYSGDGDELTAGLQSSTVCDEALIVARMLAAEMDEAVFMEDGDERTTVYPDGTATDGWYGDWD